MTSRGTQHVSTVQDRAEYVLRFRRVWDPAVQDSAGFERPRGRTRYRSLYFLEIRYPDKFFSFRDPRSGYINLQTIYPATLL